MIITPIEAPSRAWQIASNIVLPAQANATQDFRAAWFRFKTEMVGFASNPWTVVASSNGVVADENDNWNTVDDVLSVATSGDHAWIVFESSAGFQICLDGIVGGNDTGIGIFLSPSDGFSGGTISARPTAADEAALGFGNTHAWKGTLGSHNIDLVMNIFHTEDGTFTAWNVLYNNDTMAVGMIGQLENPTYAGALVGGMLSQGQNSTLNFPLRHLHTFDQANPGSSSGHRFHFANLPGKGPAPAWLVMPIVGSANTSSNARHGIVEDAHSYTPSINGVLDVHEFPPIPVFTKQSGVRGVHGMIPDIKWAGDQLATGDRVLVDGVGLWAKFGTFLFPWDDSIAVTA